MFLYSNEIVFRGHPDKLCDQIGDALLDAYLYGDPSTRAGIEVSAGKGKIFITGEVTSNSKVNIKKIVHNTLKNVGYNPSDFKIIKNLGKQSNDIALGTNDKVGGAGDQGMMFGYACNDSESFVPKAMSILQDLSKYYNDLVHQYPDDFYPDGKAQITGYYDDNFNLIKIKDFLISYSNSENSRKLTDSIIIGFVNSITQYYGINVENIIINPTGRFNIYGPNADAGVLGRKIVVDSYQSFAPVGGGAMSGKDGTKVDRSGAYKARQLAVRALQEYDLSNCTVQLSYSIGIPQPLAIYINSNKGKIEPPKEWYDECVPQNIIHEFFLNIPKFEETAKYGHFGNNFLWDKQN